MKEYDENDKSRSIRSHDKLNYRAEIQSRISNYLSAIGTFDLEKAVMALRNSVFFEIPGLPFKTEIIEKEKELMREYRDRVINLIENDRDMWIHPIKKAYWDSEFKEIHYMNLAMFLLDLIAKHDGLMQVKGNVELGNTAAVEEGGVKDNV